MASVRQPIGQAKGSWSNKRKLRLLRTAVIVLTLIWLVGRCTGGDEDSSPEPQATSSTTTEAPEQSTIPPAPNQLAASVDADALAGPRYQSGGASIGGLIYLPGGLDSTRNSTDSILTYNPETGESSDIGALDEVIHKPQVAAIGANVFVFGGAVGDVRYPSISKFDTAGSSETVGQLPGGRSDGVAVTSELDGSVYIVGGTDGNDASLEVWRTIDGANFEVIAELAEPARYPAVAISGSAIWVMGGSWGGEVSDSIQKVDLVSGETEVIGNLPNAMDHGMGFAIGGSIFVAGGVIDGTRTDAILKIDTNTGQTNPAGTLPDRISDAAVVTMDNKAYLLGGLSAEISDDVIILTPSG